MKIEKLTPNKIKIIITNDDLNEWNIDFESITGNTPEAQAMFWSAIRQAEQEVDFFVNGSQLLVEAMPNQYDGFVMFITKVEDAFSQNHSPDNNNGYKERMRNNEFRIKRKSRPFHLPSYIYQFDDFEDVCTASKNIEPFFEGKSTLHKYKNSFFLHILPNEGISSIEIDNTLVEYAHKVASPIVIEGFLNEHAKSLIEETAIETIASYF